MRAGCEKIFTKRRAVIAALLLLPGCALLRVPLPPVSFTVNVVEEDWLGALPRPIDDIPRLGVIGLVVPLPRACDFGDAESLVRAYIQQYEEEELGELANNLYLRKVHLKAIKLTALEGDFSFIADAGIRMNATHGAVTLWSEFRDRDTKTELTLTADGDFDLFDLFPGEDECVSIDLLFSGTIPDEPVKYAMDLTLEIVADYRF